MSGVAASHLTTCLWLVCVWGWVAVRVSVGWVGGCGGRGGYGWVHVCVGVHEAIMQPFDQLLYLNHVCTDNEYSVK